MVTNSTTSNSDKPALKDICTLFDNHYEQEGKKQRATVDKLKLWISETYYQEDDENIKNWLAWMYGKIYLISGFSDITILYTYEKIVEEYDRKSKELCEQFHFTTMWKVMSYNEV